MKIIEKLSTYAALIGVIGAIGGGFYTWGQFNLRLDQIENKEFVVNETVDLSGVDSSINEINVKLKELETQIISMDNNVLDDLRNDIAGNSNDMKSITQDIIKDIKVLENAINNFATEDDLDGLDKKLRKPLDKIKETVEELVKNVAIIQKENELQDVLIEEVKQLNSNPLGG
jgi:gas vesicle protein|tara:strand:- start:234 stop:752 length:519 start_codon:yes stop_codon:yes gene_type:complete